MADHVNAPLVLAQADGTTVWDWRNRDAFGNNAPIESTTLPRYSLRFPGQIADPETGLYYNYYRDYDPQIGRYIESDPIGVDGGINTYSYVLNNPATSNDPFGLDTAVILSGGIFSNPFGHIAVAATGQGVYSYGTAYPYGSRVTDYIADQAKSRNVSIIIIKTTPEQEKKIVTSMRNFSKSKYSAFGNNCADAVVTALGNAGIGEGDVNWSPILPRIPAGVALSQPGARIQTIMQGGALPSGISVFNRR